MTISAKNRDLVAPGGLVEPCNCLPEPATERRRCTPSVVKRWWPAADNGCMPVPRPRLVVAAVTAVLLAASLACPAAAVPGGGDEAAIDRARAEAARIRAEVDRLHTRVEVLAERHTATQSRLEATLRSALAHQRALDDQELVLDAARGRLGEQVRGIYAAGPLASLELMLKAADPHELAMAGQVAARSLAAGGRAVDDAAAATARSQVLVAELRGRQAEVLALRQRLAGQQAAIARALAAQRELLASAERHVLGLLAAARAREEAARRAALEAAAARARALGLEGFADAPPPTPEAATAVHAALGQLGKWYRWGAAGPDSFDCSGLTSWAYLQAGVRLPRTSRAQWGVGARVVPADLLPGDLVFYGTDALDPGSIHHVGMYVGQGLMVNAPFTGAQVRVEPLRVRGYVGATRPTA
jgi:peptidoglycan DL-endopeptidase CwlO